MVRAPAEFRDLGTSAADRALLSAFYKNLYIPAFPDADERESLYNIQRYLRKKAAGWYGANNYHAHVRLEDGELVGGAITDYLAGACSTTQRTRWPPMRAPPAPPACGPWRPR